MHLIVVHGVPGVGKRSVCNELAKLTGYRFFNSHHLVLLIGLVFGYSTPDFNDLRDRIYDGILDAAADEGLVGSSPPSSSSHRSSSNASSGTWHAPPNAAPRSSSPSSPAPRTNNGAA